MNPNAIGLSNDRSAKRREATQEGLRDKPYRTYAVYARGPDSDQSFASGEGGSGYLLELEDGFDGTLLRKSEGVHGGSKHRCVGV